MGCQKDYTDEDQQLLDEAEGRECGLPAGVIEQEMPAIEVAREDKVVDLLQKNVRNSQEELSEARTLSTSGSKGGKEEWERKLEELDHGKWPSDKESREAYRAGVECKMKNYQCASLPPVTGFGVKDIQPHIKETIRVLSQNEKLWEYRQLWSGAFANKIMFADRDALKKEGINVPEDVRAMTFRAQTLLKDKNLPSTILVFSDPLTGEFPKGRELLGHLAHEIAHENEIQFQGRDMGWFKPVALAEREVSKEAVPGTGVFMKTESSRWDLAVEAQMKQPIDRRFISISAEETHKNGDDRHFVHEHFAAWVMDSPDLCDEMRQFFDEYIPKAFGE